MSDLHDLFKRELSQIPLRPADTWVPTDSVSPSGRFRWRVALSILGAGAVLVAALAGGQQLATWRDDAAAAAAGVMAGKVLYVVPLDGSAGWTRIHAETLHDVSSPTPVGLPTGELGSLSTLVSADGTVVLITDFRGATVVRMRYDGRTGRPLGQLQTEVPMVIDALSADGSQAIGRLGSAEHAITDAKAVISLVDGRVIRRVPAASICCVDGFMYARDLSAIYYFVTPAPLPLDGVGSQPLSLVVQSTLTGAQTQPTPLPGITLTTVTTATPAGFAQQRPVGTLSPDGKRIAVLSFDASSLIVVDTGTFKVTRIMLTRQSQLMDLFGTSTAAAATLPDRESWGAAFTPDGTAIIAYRSSTQTPARGGTIRTTIRIVRIDVERGVITAESSAPEPIFTFRLAPDNTSIFFVVRAAGDTPIYLLRRLDARTLTVKAERRLTDYADLYLLAAP